MTPMHQAHRLIKEAATKWIPTGLKRHQHIPVRAPEEEEDMEAVVVDMHPRTLMAEEEVTVSVRARHLKDKVVTEVKRP